MELVCINCANKFEVGDEVLSRKEVVVRCPTCGHECVFHSASSSQIVNPVIPPPSRTGGFRRPMQVFATATKTQEQPRLKPEAVAPMPKSVDIVTPKEVPKAEPESEPSGNGKWHVRCPTGLELVFPSSQLVLAWASVVDDPNLYFVSRGGEEFVTMEEWMQKIRQGSRGTVAFRTVVAEKEKPPTSVERMESRSGDQPEPAEPKTLETTKKTVAHQLQFKTRDSRTQKRKKAIQISIFVVLVVLVGGAVLGAHYLGLF